MSFFAPFKHINRRAIRKKAMTFEEAYEGCVENLSREPDKAFLYLGYMMQAYEQLAKMLRPETSTTKEELIQALTALRADVFDDVIHGIDYSLYAWGVNVIDKATERIERPALRKWTAKDGTPPDGFYLDKIASDGRVIDVTTYPSGESCVYFLYREHANVLALDELWDEFDVLHGPIAPDNGV